MAQCENSSLRSVRTPPKRYISRVSNPTVAKNTIEIVVNGEPRLVTDGTTVETFLAAHEIDADTVVVEANGVILPRNRFGATVLLAGDTLEVVHFVGGG